MIPASDLTFHIEQRDMAEDGFETIIVLVSPVIPGNYPPGGLGLHNVAMPDYMGELTDSVFETEVDQGLDTVKADLIALGYTHQQQNFD